MQITDRALFNSKQRKRIERQMTLEGIPSLHLLIFPNNLLKQREKLRTQMGKQPAKEKLGQCQFQRCHLFLPINSKSEGCPCYCSYLYCPGWFVSWITPSLLRGTKQQGLILGCDMQLRVISRARCKLLWETLAWCQNKPRVAFCLQKKRGALLQTLLGKWG